MATVYSNNVVEIAVRMNYAGSPSVNVWHMYLDSEWGSDTMEAVVQDFANNWQDHIMENVSTEVTLLGFDFRSLDTDSGLVGTLEPDSGKPTAGGSSGSGAPPNVAYLVQKRTSNRPRGRRDGRSFITGVVESDVGSNGVVATPTVTAWNEDLQDFLDGVSDVSITAAGDRYPVVLETTAASRAPGTSAVTINSRRITALTLDPLISTQRDRLR